MPAYRKSTLNGLCALLVLLTIGSFASCGRKITRDYGPDGALKGMYFRGDDGAEYRISFDHDARQRNIAIRKTRLPEGKAVMEMKVKYSANERITFISRSALMSPDSTTREVEYNSFSYAKSGQVTRIETSFKSSYSISKYNTALITTRYQYSGGNISTIIEDGGTYRKTMKLTWDGNVPAVMEYGLLSFNWQNKTYQQKKQIEFYFSGGEPKKAVDRKSNVTVTSAKSVSALYTGEGAGRPLFRVLYGVGYKDFLENAERLLVVGK